MRWIFHSSRSIESWDYRNPDEFGIGCSECSHIELAKRLAKRGHEVISYAPIREDCQKYYEGVEWRHINETDFFLSGIWMVYRQPVLLEKFLDKREDQVIWFICQDEFYPEWKREYASVVDRFFCLCNDHAENVLRHHPELDQKIFITSNGIRMDLIRELENGSEIKRNPKRLMYASSPDRGLKYLLQTFKRVREFESEAELHIFYGFDNIDKLIQSGKGFENYQKIKSEILDLINQLNVFFHGRVNQKKLYEEWMKSAIWCYQTNFTETSCATSMEAQALGAIPITQPFWALRENVQHGIFIDGDAYHDPLVKARYIGEIVRVLGSIEFQEQIRPKMMLDARYRFNWERVVDQLELMAFDKPIQFAQFAFQMKWAKGKILNVGCDSDHANFRKLGAINLDVLLHNPLHGYKTQANIIADVRECKLKPYFDSIIIGDLLEHMTEEDAIKSLRNCSTGLKNSGYIIITCPNDNRLFGDQHKRGNGDEEYVKGVKCFHTKEISASNLRHMIKAAGLKEFHYQEIDYTHHKGHGLICHMEKE